MALSSISKTIFNLGVGLLIEAVLVNISLLCFA